MAWRPKFDTIYQGEWPYVGSDGVGIHLRSISTCPMVDFVILIMEHHGCPEPVAVKLTTDLMVNGEVKVTVAHTIDFDKLAIQLSACWVSIEIIPPRAGWTLKS